MAKGKRRKKGKTSSVKKKKQEAEKPQNEATELTILDRAHQETKLDISVQKAQAAKGESRRYTKEVFRLWLSMPDQFKGAPDRIVSLLGLTDPIALELLKLPTMQAFADEFGVMRTTLSRWRGEVERDKDFALDVKKQLRTVTRNVLGALYRKALEEADAARIKIWLQYVEDWREHLGVEHTGYVSTLTDEEKRALDKVIEKHKRKHV